MDTREIDLILLNAYVDDELDDEERGRIEAAAARDADVARRLARLAALKSATRMSVERPRLSLPSAPASGWRRALVAACLLLTMTGAGLGAVWYADESAELTVANRDPARAAHLAWTGADAPPTIRPVETSAGRIAATYVPDLTPAKLRLVHLEAIALPDETALVAGYAGSRGCRLTLVSTARPKASHSGRDLTFDETDGLLVARWRAGGLDYRLIAEGMDRRRFQTIADSVYRASRRHAPIDKDLRVAMARARAESAPCAIG